MSKDTMYYIGDLEVWRIGESADRRIPKMEMDQAEESYIRSLYHTGHVLKDVNGKECKVYEIIHPTNRV